MESGLFALVVLGLLLGLRHGIDWDHLAAIADITSSAGATRVAAIAGHHHLLGGIDGDVRLIFEPGRLIVANAGVLLSRVIRVKPGVTEPFVIADAAMNARILGQQMLKRGFSRGYAAGVLSYGSLMAPIIPPGIGFILYGTIGQVSIGRLFAAGFILALVTGWSMGAGQTYQWAVSFPEMVERIAPFCGSSKTSLHNKVFLEGVKASRFRPLPSRGTFFQNLCYDAVSDERDTDLAIRLTRERGLASIPVSVFYREPPAHRVLRFCFAKSRETLARGAEILSRL